jgi:hypothetical protein
MEGNAMAFGILETLRKLAYVLVLPLFAAAYIHDQGMLNEHYQLEPEAIIRVTESSTLDWLLSSSDVRLTTIGWCPFIDYYLIIIGSALFMTAMMIELLDRWTYGTISVVIGIGCMLLGVLFVAGLAAGAPLAKLHLFWNGGLICFGFILWDRG